MEYILRAVIYKEEDYYIAKCPQTETASQGKTIEEALANLQEATELFLEIEPLSIDSPPFITSFKVSIPDEDYLKSIKEATKKVRD
ncbi:MAG: type II toxin-antitoxin system HicB family antitoxin [Candidatus Heimdallarchaeota archaeon]